MYYLVSGLNEQAAKRGPASKAAFTQIAWLTAISWSAYPIVWAMAEGTSSISCDAEAILYCVLDVTAKVCTSSLDLFSTFGLVVLLSIVLNLFFFSSSSRAKSNIGVPR